ncbi:hypothetical protein EV421DRAFT_1744129 [Armillaria borealis]|uniref:Uncharacterized protein n=1 Tax=Armillaria borealis TaxID=47425 RepID=A0AA39IV99_9AGAR|nr:hypothetical protein EV421DRAFT_1744129 [Armillaria borealis]
MGSHVVLAACKAYQFAKTTAVKGKDGEAGYIGIFTNSLVRILRSGNWKKETTYAELVHYCDETVHQTPVVAGNHKCARIWYQEFALYIFSVIDRCYLTAAANTFESWTGIRSYSCIVSLSLSNSAPERVTKDMITCGQNRASESRSVRHKRVVQQHLSRSKAAMDVAPFPTRLGSDDAPLSHDFPSESHKNPSETMNRLAGSALRHFQLVLPVQHGAVALQCAEKDR